MPKNGKKPNRIQALKPQENPKERMGSRERKNSEFKRIMAQKRILHRAEANSRRNNCLIKC